MKREAIYRRHDDATGDAIEISIDGERVLIATTTPGRPKRLTVLCGRGEGMKLAEALHKALTAPTRNNPRGPRIPRTVRLS